jgi:hypothetical protein
MSRQTWSHLDSLLGFVEAVALPLIAIGLLRALVRPGRRHVRRLVVLAIVLGAALVQPFGVRAHGLSEREFFRPGVHRVNAEAVHSLSVLGLPLFGFRAYTRHIWRLEGDGGQPNRWLKVRSWLWPGLLTHATKVEQLCGATDTPCWAPDSLGPHSQLELWRTRTGDYRYRVLTRQRSRPRLPARPAAGYSYSFGYAVKIGIASPIGLAYWILGGIVVAAIVINPRNRLRRSATDSAQALAA